MISFAYPAMLWSLMALIVPITIHLLSRKEGSVIPLGSLKHIQETSTQQFRGIRLNELLLLLLRCAMIIILSLMLSGLSFHRAGKEKWVLVEPNAEQIPVVKSQIDSLIQEGYEARWFADGFPMMSDSITQVSYSYHHLLENVKSRNLEQAVIFSFSKATRFNGAQVTLPEYVQWMSVPVEENEHPLYAVALRDRVYERWIVSNAHRTQLNTRVARGQQTGELHLPSRIRVHIKESDDTRQNQVMKAVIAAIDESSPFHEVVFTGVDSAQWVIWLSKEALPDLRANVLCVQPQTSGQLLIQKKANRWELTQYANEEIVLNGNLLTTLAPLILQNPSVEKEINEMDQRMVPDSTAWAYAAVEASEGKVMQSAMSGLFIVLMLVILMERLLSYQRQQ